ncbi:MAG: T9SS type A sorting domain-containing protein [Bacteroidetes bacterium]|nr:T9SS type A sorting domain-containing protein [Bacteroidota bacterium]
MNIRTQLVARATAVLLLLLAAQFSAHAQTPVIAYITPDIGTPGMNTYVEIIGPHGRTNGFGTDNIYTNNPGDAVQVVVDNLDDTSTIRFGPCVVSWNGRMISTQVFVMPWVNATTTDWETGIKVAFHVVVGGVSSNSDTFYIVKPQNLGINHVFSFGGQFGSGIQSGVNYGLRSRRGAMIVDSLIVLGSGTYGVSTQDCDPIMNGNQGYLPLTMISKGPIRLSASSTLSVNAKGVHGGIGGGGGGDGLTCGTFGGDGYTGGGGNANWLDACGVGAPGPPEGNGTGSTTASLNGLPGGGTSSQNEGGGGGSGHPFGASGTAGGDDSNNPQPVSAGYGGGTGGPNCCPPQEQGGGGGGGYGSAGADGGNYKGAGSGGFITGNNEIIPLAGGSGGGGGNVNSTAISDAGSGGGGGGAIALFGVTTTASGSITAIGGTGTNSPNNGAGGGGSGGGVVLGAKLSLAVNAIDVAGGPGGAGHPVASGQDGGIGGAGRARFDGHAIGVKPVVNANATQYHGPSTDSSGWVNKTFTLTGSGNGKDIRIYVKPLSGKWALASTVTSYLNNWSTTVTLPGSDTIFLLAAVQQVSSPSTAPYTSEPNWVMSQSAANILHSYCAGPALALSEQKIDLGSVSICSEIFDTIIVTNTGCDTAHLSKKLDDLSIGASFVRTGVTVLPSGERDTVILRFKPIKVGAVSTNLHITLDHGDSVLVLTALGTSGDTALTPSPRTLNFDTVSICSQLTRSILLSNTGCDSVTVTNVSAPTLGDFTLGNSLVGRKLHVGDTVSLVCTESGTGAGTKLDSVEITVQNAAGIPQTITAYLSITIVPRQRLLSFNPNVRLDSLAPCTPFDTTIWITNLGVCDTLDFSSITTSGFVQLSASAAVPKRIVPGDSFPISVHVTGANFMTGTATVRMQGGNFDTTFVIQTTGRVSGAPFVLTISDSVFASTFCHTATERFTIRNTSCNPVTIDTTFLAGSRQYYFIPVPTTPATIQPGDSLPLIIVFDPTITGDSLGTLTYRSSQYGIRRTIGLRGFLSSEHQSAGVTIAIDPTSKSVVKTGETVVANLSLANAISAGIPVTSVQIGLDYNTDLLDVVATNVIGMPGFQLTNYSPRKSGMDLSFSRTSSGAVAAGAPISKITFTAMLTDTDKTTVRVSSVGFNNNDSLFDVCVLVPQSGSSFDVALSDFCGKPTLLKYLKSGVLVIENVRIAPDPVQITSSSLTVSFDLHLASMVEVSIADVLGKSIYRQIVNESSAGSKQYRIPTATLPSGTYIVRLRTPSQVVSVPIVVAR